MATALTLDRPATDRVRPSARPAGPAAPGRVPLVGWSISAAGVLLLAFVGFLVFGSSVQNNRAQDLLYARIADELGQATAPVSGIIAPGTPIGVLEIPRLGLRQALLEGSSADQTAQGPGLTSGTAFPGQAGNSVVLGRRSTFGAAFADLDRLRVGDLIRVSTGQGRLRFRVDLVRRSDDPATAIARVPSRLTLVTSDPALTPTRRLIVSAALLGTPYPTTVQPVTRPGEGPGEHTLDNAVLVLLWTQGLLLAVWVATRAALRFPKRAVWIGAVPVLLAVLWHVFEGVAALLPNTL